MIDRSKQQMNVVVIKHGFRIKLTSKWPGLFYSWDNGIGLCESHTFKF